MKQFKNVMNGDVIYMANMNHINVDEFKVVNIRNEKDSTLTLEVVLPKRYEDESYSNLLTVDTEKCNNIERMYRCACFTEKEAAILWLSGELKKDFYIEQRYLSQYFNKIEEFDRNNREVIENNIKQKYGLETCKVIDAFD